MATSNTQRTLKWLRDQGYSAGIVERYLSYAGKFGKRKDLFGFIDIIAIDGNDIVAVQSCGQAFLEHHRKITKTEEIAAEAKKWLESGGRIILIGWRKIKKTKGGKQMIWVPRIKEYSLEDFSIEEV